MWVPAVVTSQVKCSKKYKLQNKNISRSALISLFSLQKKIKTYRTFNAVPYVFVCVSVSLIRGKNLSNPIIKKSSANSLKIHIL